MPLSQHDPVRGVIPNPEIMQHEHLRSGTSLWRATGVEPVACPRLEGAIGCEVAIVGAGITGALVGYLLSQAGVNVVLIDRESVGLGSTAASTGLLQYEVDTPLTGLIAKVGEAKAVHAYRRGLQAVGELEGLAGELSADLGFARRSTLCLASEEADLADLRREYECRRHFGFDVSFLERSAIQEEFAIRAPGALFSNGDGEVNPYALTQRLVARARQNGLRAFKNVEVESLRENAAGVVLQCPSGPIEAKAAVLATGYSARPFLADSLASLQTTYAVASEPLPRIPRWPHR